MFENPFTAKLTKMCSILNKNFAGPAFEKIVDQFQEE